MSTEIERTTERLITVLGELRHMADANIARSNQIQARIDHLLIRLRAGEQLPDIVERERRPLIPELVTQNIEALQDVGLTLRKAEAAALRAHGYSMNRIAQLFGVTRQRIAAVLKS